MPCNQALANSQQNRVEVLRFHAKGDGFVSSNPRPARPHFNNLVDAAKLDFGVSIAFDVIVFVLTINVD